MTTIPINTKVDSKMHPDQIRGESPGAKTARVALGGLYVAEGKIRDLHEIVKGKALLHQRQAMATMPKPKEGHKPLAPALVFDQNAADHVVTVGTPLAQAALNGADKTIASLGETVTRLDATISLKITEGKNPARGQELRAHFARLESPFLSLGALFQKADENKTLVAEILIGEPYLSGITDANQAVLRQVASDVLASEEVQARKEAAGALDHLTASAKSFVAATAEIFTSLASPEIGAINSIVSTGADQ